MLFTVSSKVSFKTTLLHNGNKVTSVPLVKAVNMKETREYLQVLLQKNKLLRTPVGYMC